MKESIDWNCFKCGALQHYDNKDWVPACRCAREITKGAFDKALKKVEKNQGARGMKSNNDGMDKNWKPSGKPMSKSEMIARISGDEGRIKDLRAKLEASENENRKLEASFHNIANKLEASKKELEKWKNSSKIWSKRDYDKEDDVPKLRQKLEIAVEELNWIDERCCEPCCLHARKALKKIKGCEGD